MGLENIPNALSRTPSPSPLLWEQTVPAAERGNEQGVQEVNLISLSDWLINSFIYPSLLPIGSMHC